MLGESVWDRLVARAFKLPRRRRTWCRFLPSPVMAVPATSAVQPLALLKLPHKRVDAL